MDSWSAISITNAPSARASHTAVWTGSEMIVWGGSGNSGSLNTGGRYNPAADSWNATNTIGAPSARSSHTVVWTGNEMIVWGGYDNVVGYSNTGGRYNPGTDRLGQPPPRLTHPLGESRTPRYGPTLK